MVEVRELRKRYGDTVALDGLSFSVAPGQVVGFVGPNGAAKTTTMRIILGVLEPDTARSCGTPGPSTPTPGGASGICPRSAACTRRCACAISSSTWPSCTGSPRRSYTTRTVLRMGAPLKLTQALRLARSR